jgi:hypothetical protein
MEEQIMVAKIMMALGLIVTMAAATATPSLAQRVYFEGPGFGVDVGRPAYRDRDYRYRAYNYVPRDRYRHGCRTVTIQRDDGSVRRIRRCDWD